MLPLIMPKDGAARKLCRVLRPGLALLAVLLALTAPPPSAQSTTTFDVVEKSIPELQDAMRSGRVTSRQLVEAYLDRIRRYDKAGPALNAYIALNPRALDEAAALDEERRRTGARGILHGIPIAVKDNYITADLPTTNGSKSLEGFIAGKDAFIVEKLRRAGVVVLGKTNLHEFAYGITSISSMGGQTKNPYDLSRNPGGSSGGTGAAVAASLAAAGLGTDTCGSIRIPAAHNALVGMRGTMGLSSRRGIMPLATTQDGGGPIARSVTDLAIMLDAIVGEDPDDPVTAGAGRNIPRTYLGVIGDRELGDARIGVLTPLFGTAPEDQEVAAIVREAITAIQEMGAGAVEVSMPDLLEILQGTSVINAEFKFDLQDFLKPFPNAPVHTLTEVIAGGKFDPAVDGVLRRAEAVATRESSAYDEALARREAVRQRIITTMTTRGVTALAYPVIRRKAAAIGQTQGGSNCQLSATTGLPALAVPAGFTPDGLPVGLELLGMPFTEPHLLKIAYAYEQVMSPRRPPKSTP
jgi:amidase